MLFVVALLVALTGSYGSTSQDELQSSSVLNQIVMENLLMEEAIYNDKTTKEGIRGTINDVISQLRNIHEELKTEIVSEILFAITAQGTELKGDLSDRLRGIMGEQSNRTQTPTIEELEGVTREMRSRIASQDAEIRDLKAKLQQEERNFSEQEKITQSKNKRVQELEAQLRQQEEKIQAQEEKIQAQEQEIQQLLEAVSELKRQEETENLPSTTVQTPWGRNETDHLPRDCSHHWMRYQGESGRYTIFPVPGGPGVDVWCDMNVDGPWTVILSRSPQPHRENFSRSWEEYKAGFGNASTEYWLGLDALHALTSRTPHHLKVQIQYFDDQDYDGGIRKFAVSDEDSQYEVRMQGGYGIGKYLRANNGKKFSTTDRDNDQSSFDCVKYHGGGGGWWYGFGRVIGGGTSFVSVCTLTNPTAKVARSEYADDGVMSWPYEEKRLYISLKKVVMRIQPNFK